VVLIETVTPVIAASVSSAVLTVAGNALKAIAEVVSVSPASTTPSAFASFQ
jgi:hypothetical protein